MNGIDVKKPDNAACYCRQTVRGDEWPGYGSMCPQLNLAFSLEEAPTFGLGSSQPLMRLVEDYFSACQERRSR